MKPEDFYQLRIGQVIWYKGFSKKIVKLFAYHNCSVGYIQFDGDKTYTWNDIREQCSLEAPKEKRVFYKWIFDERDEENKEVGLLYCCEGWYDENGVSIDGKSSYSTMTWEKLKKKKIESIFWEE